MHLDPSIPPMQLLDRIGPDAPHSESISVAKAVEYCRGLATSHYENFSVLTSLVPPDLRDDFAAVYAFCRWADDLGDETGLDEAARARSLDLLAWWRAQLRECFASIASQAPPSNPTTSPPPPRHPVFIALASTARKHAASGLSAKPFDDLISAFEQDQRITRYRTWDQLCDYCTRSANPVGRIVLMLGGYAPPEINPANHERFRLSDMTCTALQLVNFWQDVRRDLVERDRIYLPLDECSLTPGLLRKWLDQPADSVSRVTFIRAVRPLLERTAAMFQDSRDLPRMLDGRIGPVVWLFGAGGRAIAEAIEHRGCTTLWNRPKLSKAEKALLVAQAWWLKRFW